MGLRRRERSATRLPRVSGLTDGEIGWRDDQLEIARLLAERYVGKTTVLPEITSLDDVVTGWLDDDDTRVDINTVINAVGIAMGQHLAKTADLTWVIATDDDGSDLALHGQPGDILIFPANATAKRLVTGERRFVAPIFTQLVEGVRERRQRG